MSHDKEVSNNSDNRGFDDVLQHYLSFRTVLKGGFGAVAVSMIRFSGLSSAQDDDDDLEENADTAADQALQNGIGHDGRRFFPMDATQKPVKRTALGRFNHEGVALVRSRDLLITAGGQIIA